MCRLQFRPSRRHKNWHWNRPSALQSLPVSLRLPISLRLPVPILPPVLLLWVSVSALCSSGPGLRAACAGLPGADLSTGAANLCPTINANLRPAGGHGSDERLPRIGPELHAATASAAADASTTPGRASAAADAAASASGGPGRPTYVGTAGRESAGGNSNASCSADSGRARNVLDAECAGMIGALDLIAWASRVGMAVVLPSPFFRQGAAVQLPPQR